MTRNYLLIVLLPFVLASCLTLNADIVINRSGSGTIALEYLMSKSLDALGRQDGNQRWNTIPAGRADMERTVDRLPEVRLLSFSSREDERNLRISAKLEFDSINGLMSFLDASGRRSALSGDAASGRMVLTLSESAEPVDPALGSLIAAISEGYSVRISLTLPTEGRLSVTDAQGRSLATPGSRITAAGKSLSCFFPLSEVLSASGGINAEFSW